MPALDPNPEPDESTLHPINIAQANAWLLSGLEIRIVHEFLCLTRGSRGSVLGMLRAGRSGVQIPVCARYFSQKRPGRL
jgi:hypothetical protein